MWGRRLLTALFSWVSRFTAAPADTVMTAEQFTRFYAERAEALLPGSKATVKGILEVQLEVKVDSNSLVAMHHLENAFREYAADPGEIDTIVSRWVNGFRSSFEKEAIVTRDQLVLVLRHKSFLDPEMPGVHHWPLAGDIHVIYAVDTPDVVCYPSQEKLDVLGLDECALTALALENLKRIRMTPQIVAHPTLAFVSGADAYLASILFEDDFWSAERFAYRGDIVVIVAARDLLLVTGSHENEGLEAIARIAHQVAGEAPYAISTEPIIRRDGKWQSFVQ